MRILVDSCAYTARNVGDLAMLSVAVSRLRDLFPDATIQIITGAPEIVTLHCGDIEPVPLNGRRLVVQDRLLGRVDKWLPSRLAARWSALEPRLRLRYTALAQLSLRLKAFGKGRHLPDARSFLSAIDRADLVVVSGAGVITEAFSENASGILATLGMAIRRGVPTAMFGQGIGPIVTQELRSRAEEVLPKVRLIAVRERLFTVPLLSSLGVSPDRIVVTGDDAIELALSGQSMGSRNTSDTCRKIGVNVRLAPYADVSAEQLALVREALETASRAHAAELVPVPIAHRDQMDVEVLRELLTGLTHADTDGGMKLNSPKRVIDQIHACRVVVTGSYHGAVFALAQGIPAVALASSRYYRNKMQGLADQFGEGCDVVALEPGPTLRSRIEAAIDSAWRNIDRLRPTLLARSADQVERGRAAYARLLSIHSH